MHSRAGFFFTNVIVLGLVSGCTVFDWEAIEFKLDSQQTTNAVYIQLSTTIERYLTQQGFFCRRYDEAPRPNRDELKCQRSAEPGFVTTTNKTLIVTLSRVKNTTTNEYRGVVLKYKFDYLTVSPFRPGKGSLKKYQNGLQRQLRPILDRYAHELSSGGSIF